MYWLPQPLITNTLECNFGVFKGFLLARRHLEPASRALWWAGGAKMLASVFGGGVVEVACSAA